MTNFRALGCGGLEYHSGRNTILNYLTSYSCKGGVSTEEYNVMAAAVTEAYLARDDNSNKTIKSVKHLLLSIQLGHQFICIKRKMNR